jgi:hypothetical protein
MNPAIANPIVATNPPAGEPVLAIGVACSLNSNLG